MIFIDCGFWEGRALEIYKQKGLVDDSWDIYAFEPNPELDVPASVERIGLPVGILEYAVWTEYTTLNFSPRGNASLITDDGSVEVETIDFSEFVSSLPDEPIICNMDIEGAEFPVLRKMIKDGSIKKIAILEVEFHHRFVEGESVASAEKIIDDLFRRGVKVIIKVPLS